MAKKGFTGGIAGMLGEPRSGYPGGGSATKTNALVKELYDAAGGFDGTGKSFSEFMADVLYEGDYLSRAKGGRIGFGEGDTPSEAYLREIFFSIPTGDQLGTMSFEEWKRSSGGQHYIDKWRSGNRAEGGRIGYDNGGPVTQEDYDAYVAQKESEGEEPMDFETYKIFKIEFPGLAQGGRIGFKEGEGIMSRVGDMVDVRNVPYYGGKALQGLVNSAETLSKFPLAAGELGSKLIQQPPKKEMFMKAIENITPGSWSENLGLTSLVEGMGEKRPKDAQTVGGILGLGTEIAVPTGGAFKAGQLLLNKASKAMGKVKDGKTLEKLVDQKLTDSGQSRRDFNIMASTSGLVGALKWLGLGGILKTTSKLKPSDDVVMRLRTWIDDSDVDTEWGPQATAQWAGAFDVEGLSTAAVKTLKKIMKKMEYKDDNLTAIGGELIPTDDAAYVLDALKKAGHKVKFEHLDDAGGMGIDDMLKNFKEGSLYKGTKEGAEKYKKFKEKTDKWSARKKAEWHNDITDDYGHHYDQGVEEFFDEFYGVVKKAEGGRIGYDEGGWTQKDFDKYLQDRKKRDKENLKKDFLDDFEQWKKWKETEGGTMDWAAQGGRIGLDTGGPPITLQRPMFNEGGLTKTIPPKRGPDPQGLPSALYNGIMRPRSY